MAITVEIIALISPTHLQVYVTGLLQQTVITIQ